MKILLTGATGFVGSHVARALVRQGHEVHALVRPHSDRWRIADIQSSLCVVKQDLLDSSFSLPPAAVDICIHLAWDVEPGEYLDSPRNLEYLIASLRLARVLAEGGCKRFVAAGTCFEYNTEPGLLTESTPTRPRTLYAASKLALFTALEAFCARAGMSFAWTRIFYLYGPLEHPRRLVPLIINSLLQQRPAKLGPGHLVRDYLHVEDVAGAVCAVAMGGLTGAVNIGSRQALTIEQLARKIGELLGRPELIHLGAIAQGPDDPAHVLADNSKLCLGTNWQPQYDIDNGLRNTIAWWKERSS